MGQIIHARKTAKNTRYRVWSTISDSYLTKELTEKQLRNWTLAEALGQARREHEREFPERLERANATGTSSRMGSDRAIVSDWDKERT